MACRRPQARAAAGTEKPAAARIAAVRSFAVVSAEEEAARMPVAGAHKLAPAQAVAQAVARMPVAGASTLAPAEAVAARMPVAAAYTFVPAPGFRSYCRISSLR